MSVAPPKVERVTPDDAEILDFNSLRNALGLQYSLPGPLVNALRARAGPPQVGGAITALPAVAPRDAQREVVFVFDFRWLDLRPASFHANHFCSGNLNPMYVPALSPISPSKVELNSGIDRLL